MSSYLLAITIGPVQEFISAARRTRDLWFGSFLLSEISKATAKSVRDQGGGLIFPYSADLATDLQPATEDQSTKTFNVVNVILAEIMEGGNPKNVADDAKKKAHAMWEVWAKKSHGVAGEIIDNAVWKSQENDVMEFYAAWTPFDGKNYAEARQRVMCLLAGRKALRDFKPSHGLPKVPKSSLDGMRESVLIRGATREKTDEKRKEILQNNNSLAHRLRLRTGEELDVVGLTKRAATKEVFASVVRVAVDPWTRGIEADGGEALDILKNDIGALCHELVGKTPEESAHVTGTGRHYRDTVFPYDGSMLLPNRLDVIIRETEEEKGLFNTSDREIFRDINPFLHKLIKEIEYGEPEPYLAVLAADGDGMGKLLIQLARQGGVKKHREFTQAQSDFARKVPEIVHQVYHGCAVFAGGDDVLAFVPVDKSLACARALREGYATALNGFDYVAEDGQRVTPTLSVGIAIGHCLEPLEDLLQFARDAEKQAKGKTLERSQRGDGLALHLHTRSGSAVHLRGRWEDGADGFDMRMEEWIDLHLTNALSHKAAYDLHRLTQNYEGWHDENTTRDAMAADAKRLINRKQIDKNKREGIDKHLQRALERTEGGKAWEGLKHLADEWIVARQMARAYRQALGQNGYASLMATQSKEAP